MRMRPWFERVRMLPCCRCRQEEWGAAVVEGVEAIGDAERGAEAFVGGGGLANASAAAAAGAAALWAREVSRATCTHAGSCFSSHSTRCPPRVASLHTVSPRGCAQEGEGEALGGALLWWLRTPADNEVCPDGGEPILGRWPHIWTEASPY